jgi:hypothetical protein
LRAARVLVDEPRIADGCVHRAGDIGAVERLREVNATVKVGESGLLNRLVVGSQITIGPERATRLDQPQGTEIFAAFAQPAG